MMVEIPLPTMLHPMPKRIIRNTLYSIAGNWILLAFNFLIVPFIIRHLGVETYGGVWIVWSIVVSYATLFDLGIGSSCVKYITEYAARQQYDDINKVVSTGMVFYAIFALTVALGIVGFGKTLLSFIGVPHHLLGDSYFVLVVAMIIVIFTNTMTPITSVITAFQRMEISNLIAITAGMINLLQTVIILEMGWGIRGLIIGTLIVHIGSTAWMIYWAYRLIPQLAPRPIWIRWNTFQQLWRYGTDLQISRISQIVVFQTDRIVALRFFGAASAAFYEVAVKVALLVRNIPLVLTSALLPVASEMDAKKEDYKVVFLFERASKYLIIVGLFLLGFVFLESRLIVETWVGKVLGEDGIRVATTLMRILLVGYFLNMVTGVASTIAAGIGKTNLERRTGLLLLVVSPALTASLLFGLGFYGIALSTMISLSIGAIYYMKLFSNVMEKPLFHFLQLFWKPVFCITASVIATEFADMVFLHSAVSTRVEGMIQLSLLFGVYVGTYIASLMVVRTLDDYDTLIVKTLFNKLRFRSGEIT